MAWNSSPSATTGDVWMSAALLAMCVFHITAPVEAWSAYCVGGLLLAT